MIYSEDIGKTVRSGNFIGTLEEIRDDGMALIEAENGEFMRVHEDETRLTVLSDFVHPNMPAVKYHHCFKDRKHEPHYFGTGICTGQGLDSEGHVKLAPLFKFAEQLCENLATHVQHLWKARDFIYECQGRN